MPKYDRTTVLGAPNGRHDNPILRSEVQLVRVLNEVATELRHCHDAACVQVKVGALITELPRVLLDVVPNSEIQRQSGRHLEVVLNEGSQILRPVVKPPTKCGVVERVRQSE